MGAFERMGDGYDTHVKENIMGGFLDPCGMTWARNVQIATDSETGDGGEGLKNGNTASPLLCFLLKYCENSCHVSPFV